MIIAIYIILIILGSIAKGGATRSKLLIAKILYGYINGEFWEKYYEEYDYYHQKLDELKNNLQ